MKYFFPPRGQSFEYLQTNRSDDLGSIWSSFNLDFQSKLRTLKLAQKLVINTSSSDDSDLGLPVAFALWYDEWWAICGTRLFKNGVANIVTGFTEVTTIPYTIGDSTSQFDVTNPGGNTFRYTWDTTGTNPGISTTTFPIGASVVISGTNLNAGNRGSFTVTGSGTNYFEVTNAGGVAENNKTIGSGYISVLGGTFGLDFSTTQSDMLVYNDQLFVSTANRLYYKDISDSSSNPFYQIHVFGSTSAPHKLCYFQKFDRLYIIDQALTSSNSNNIISIDPDNVLSTSGNYTLVLPTSVSKISTMVSNSSSMWIATFRNVTGADTVAINQTRCAILQWDGQSQFTIEHPVDAGAILAMCVIDDIPYALDSEGRILGYNGSSFKEVARLPIDRTLLLNATDYNVAKFAHFNGIIGTKNNTILVNINNLNDDNIADVTENLPSGIWELDLNTKNFTHKYSPTLKTLASSTINDYGQNRISAVGAIKLNPLQSNSSTGRSTIIAGFNIYTDATTVKSAIYIDSPSKPTTDTEGQKRGYVITTFFSSLEITDMWQKVWAIFRRFLNSADKIILKYRFVDEDPIYATITWTSDITFTTTTDVSAYDPSQDPFDGTTGGEVEVLQGTGAGSCTHIASVTENAGTYTVTLDTAVTGVSGTAKARFQKWIKLLPEITGQVLSYGSASIGKSEIKIQIKAVFEFTGDDEFYGIILNSDEGVNIDS